MGAAFKLGAHFLNSPTQPQTLTFCFGEKVFQVQMFKPFMQVRRAVAAIILFKLVFVIITPARLGLDILKAG